MVTHEWQLDESGKIDRFALDYENHNGPVCEICFEGFCVWCTPNWDLLECEG